MAYRANYALVNVSAHLGPTKEALDVPWAEFVGDTTSKFEFTVPTDRASDPYLGLQVFRVGDFGHEIRINDGLLGGFDLPPAEGWQYWEDAITDAELEEGTNSLQIRRDQTTEDSFAVNNVTVHWREPVE